MNTLITNSDAKPVDYRLTTRVWSQVVKTVDYELVGSAINNMWHQVEETNLVRTNIHDRINEP